ncbi:hypothetical protein XENOCAPTIV_007447 [Xenoophorus captivus]|uniref:Microtubule-associated protein 6 n=1 Tax=Xenoophorus captivus TaxID=1517983 RepID=A0ABV0RPE5_9TELE
MIRAKSQYLPPDEKTSLETSYSANFKGQAPVQATDNKAQERRRIRSLYSEPYIDPSKQVGRYSVPRSKPKKSGAPAAGQGKPVRKAKDKQSATLKGSKKTTSENQPENRPAVGDKEKNIRDRKLLFKTLHVKLFPFLPQIYRNRAQHLLLQSERLKVLCLCSVSQQPSPPYISKLNINPIGDKGPTH